MFLSGNGLWIYRHSHAGASSPHSLWLFFFHHWKYSHYESHSTNRFLWNIALFVNLSTYVLFRIAILPGCRNTISVNLGTVHYFSWNGISAMQEVFILRYGEGAGIGHSSFCVLYDAPYHVRLVISTGHCSAIFIAVHEAFLTLAGCISQGHRKPFSDLPCYLGVARDH